MIYTKKDGDPVTILGGEITGQEPIYYRTASSDKVLKGTIGSFRTTKGLSEIFQAVREANKTDKVISDKKYYAVIAINDDSTVRAITISEDIKEIHKQIATDKAEGGLILTTDAVKIR